MIKIPPKNMKFDSLWILLAWDFYTW